MPASRRARGDGSIWHAKDGRWRGRVVVEGQTVTVSGATETEARNRLAMRKAEVLTGGGAPSSQRGMTVETFAAGWLLQAVTRFQAGKLKPSTLESYTNMVERYIVPLLGGVRLAKLRPHHVTAWHAEMLERGWSPGTVSAAHKVLAAMLKQAQRERLVLDNAASLAGGPAGVEPRTDHLSVDEVAKVVAAFDGTRPSAGVALGLLGLRRGEVLGLRWDDVDLDRGLVTVRTAIVAVQGRGSVGTPKRRASYRTIRLDPVLADELRAWRAVQRERRMVAGPLWREGGWVLTTKVGNALDPNNLRRDVGRFVEAACGRSVSPHVLRHTSASLMFAEGVPVTNIADHLGHSGPAVTSKVYVHLFDEGRKVAGDALGRALRGAGEGGSSRRDKSI